MGSALQLSETYHFRIGARRLTLHKRHGESYEYVLLKALGYALFHRELPQLEIERPAGFRYVPDLIALDERGRIRLWGECGQVSLRKIAWLAKHSGAERIVLLKMEIVARHFVEQVRGEVAARYRPTGRIVLFNFDRACIAEAGQEFDEVPAAWYERHDI